jgi:iron(III) transport system substrate-binding protein
MITRKRALFASLVALVMVGAGCGGSSGGSSSGGGGGGGGGASAISPNQSMSDLVAAAKKEGTVVWLESQPESFAKQTADAFKKQYGITVQYSAINAVPLQQRYFGEAQAGKIATDVVMTDSGSTFYQEAHAKGWVQSLKDAALPTLQGNTEYPAKYMSDDTATVAFTPFLFFYSKDKLSAADAPKSIGDMANPKYKGMINIPDVRVSDTFVQYFDAVDQKYGDEFFKGLMANKPKVFPAVSAGAQAVAAGDGAIIFPAVHSVGVPIIAAGGPLVEVTPAYTTGPQSAIYITAYDKAPHPNAAKLFANWLLSKEGNLAACGTLAISPYAQKGFPSEYVPMRPLTPEIKQHIYKLMGY